MTSLLKVTEVELLGRKFIVAVDEQNRYWGIEEKAINEDGTLNQQINGLKGNMSDTAEQCVERCRQRIMVDSLVEQGINCYVASAMVVMNMPKEVAEQLFKDKL